MITLLRIELRKLLPYRAFWAILALYVVVMLLMVYYSSSIQINGQKLGTQLYNFPGIWNKLTYAGSFFTMLLGILVIMLITDEYSFRTLRQQIIDGLPKTEFIQAKFLVILVLALIISLFLFFTGLGFGLAFSNSESSGKVFQDVTYVVYYFVQAVGYMAMALFFGIVFRKSTLAIIAFLIYNIAIESLLQLKVPDNIDKFFPNKALSALTPNPTQQIIDGFTGSITEILTPQQALLPVAAYILLFCVASYFILKVRDI
jgi:ABC-2 type transport system permease protein